MLPAAVYVGVTDSTGQLNWLQLSHGSFEIGYSPYDILDLSANPSAQNQALPPLQRMVILSDILKPDEILDDVLEELFVRNQIEVGNNEELVHTVNPTPLGLMWHDFILDDSPQLLGGVEGRGLAYSQDILMRLMKKYSKPGHWNFRGIFRAHQVCL